MMENYMSVDKNMIDQSMIGNTEVAWYDIKQKPFSLHGFYDPLNTPYYRRVPADVAAATSEGSPTRISGVSSQSASIAS